MDRRLPIFPLSIVLFPGTPQFFHIFEQRYRQMLADCMEGDRTFGISFVEPDADQDPAPRPGDIGCLALIQGTRRLPDGRSNVLTMGGDRYVLKHYVEADLPYLVASVDTFDDVDEEIPELDELAARVRARFLRFVEGMHRLNDQDPEAPTLAREPRALSFEVAAGIDLDVAIKQELLVMRSTRERLIRLDTMLDELNHEVVRRAAVHVRARRNGRGGPNPDIVKAE